MAKRDVALEITQKFIDAIEGGMLNGKWERPWELLGEMPTNALTSKRYSGVNALLLMMHGSGQFATYKQWAELGAQVRKGEKGLMILVPMLKKDDDGEQSLIGWKGATVFAASQVDGYEVPQAKVLTDFQRHEAAEAIVEASGVVLNHGGDRAYYMPSVDRVQMPTREQFASETAYYATLLHELVHWTGHADRLDRGLNTTRFGDEAYAFEELVAELGASFLCAELGIHQGFDENHAKYLKAWLKVLKNDKNAIMTAASLAQKAATFLTSAADKVREDDDKLAA